MGGRRFACYALWSFIDTKHFLTARYFMAYFNNWPFQIIYHFISFFFWLYFVGFQVLSFLCGVTSPYHIFYMDTPCMIFLGIGYDWRDIWVTSVCVWILYLKQGLCQPPVFIPIYFMLNYINYITCRMQEKKPFLNCKLCHLASKRTHMHRCVIQPDIVHKLQPIHFLSLSLSLSVSLSLSISSLPPGGGLLHSRYEK